MGMMSGTMLGIITDFGVNYTVANIRANAECFVEQYAPDLVCAGWITLASLAALLAIVGIQLTSRKPRREATEGDSDPTKYRPT
jgi:hypothetical protein